MLKNASSHMVKSGNFQIHCGNLKCQYFFFNFFYTRLYHPTTYFFTITKDFSRLSFFTPPQQSTCMSSRESYGKDGSTIQSVQNLRSTYLALSTVPYQHTVLQFNFLNVPVPLQKRCTVPVYHTSLQKLRSK